MLPAPTFSGSLFPNMLLQHVLPPHLRKLTLSGGGAVPWFQVCSKEPPSAKDGSDSKLTVIPVLSLEVIPRRVLHRGCSVGREVTLQMQPSWSLFPSLSHPLPRSPNLLPPSSAKTSYLHSNLSFGVSFEENLAQFGRSWMLNGKWW